MKQTKSTKMLLIKKQESPKEVLKVEILDNVTRKIKDLNVDKPKAQMRGIFSELEDL